MKHRILASRGQHGLALLMPALLAALLFAGCGSDEPAARKPAATPLRTRPAATVTALAQSANKSAARSVFPTPTPSTSAAPAADTVALSLPTPTPATASAESPDGPVGADTVGSDMAGGDMAGQPLLFDTYRAQTANQVQGTLAAGESRTISTALTSSTAAMLVVYADHALETMLTDPTGVVVVLDGPEVNQRQFHAVIDPAANDFAPMWEYVWQLDRPATGTWQLTLSAAETTLFGTAFMAESSLKLVVFPDGGSYQPGELITLKMGVFDGAQALAGYTFTATARLRDWSTFPLHFVDDGTQGDEQAGDNRFVVQFPAPDVPGMLTWQVQASDGTVMRYAEDGVLIVRDTATITNVGNEQALDEDGDGLIDALTFDVTFDVTEAGIYLVVANLITPDGEKLDDAVDNTSLVGEPYAVGEHVATLRFDGQALRERGSEGPYVVDYLRIEHHTDAYDYGATVDVANQVYTTTATLRSDQFTGEPLRVLSTAEELRDLDADGLAGSLAISVQFDVLQPGSYSWIGMLYDAQGTAIGQAKGSGTLDSSHPATFVFPGGYFSVPGFDGPYTLSDVFVTREEGQIKSFYIGDVRTTEPYRATQFADVR